MHIFLLLLCCIWIAFQYCSAQNDILVYGTTKVNRENAKSRCIDMGAYKLATFETPEERVHIRSHVEKNFKSKVDFLLFKPLTLNKFYVGSLTFATDQNGAVEILARSSMIKQLIFSNWLLSKMTQKVYALPQLSPFACSVKKRFFFVFL